MSLEVSAKLLDYSEVSRSPTFWDPLIGLTYRKHLGKKWASTCTVMAVGLELGPM